MQGNLNGGWTTLFQAIYHFKMAISVDRVMFLMNAGVVNFRIH